MTAGPASGTAPGVEVCPRCATEFSCHAAEPGTRCWCGTVAVTDKRLGQIAGRFEGCLCPGCLTELAGA